MKIKAGEKYFWTTEGRNVRVKALTESDDGKWDCRLLEASERDGLDKGDEKRIKAKNLSDTKMETTIEVEATPVADVKKPKREAPPAPPKVATLLVGTSIVFCGENPVLIMSGANSTWSDLMCWSIGLQTTMHLHRVDLEPKDAVDATIAELQKHIKINSGKRS